MDKLIKRNLITELNEYENKIFNLANINKDQLNEGYSLHFFRDNFIKINANDIFNNSILLAYVIIFIDNKKDRLEFQLLENDINIPDNTKVIRERKFNLDGVIKIDPIKFFNKQYIKNFKTRILLNLAFLEYCNGYIYSSYKEKWIYIGIDDRLKMLMHDILSLISYSRYHMNDEQIKECIKKYNKLINELYLCNLFNASLNDKHLVCLYDGTILKL